jgi:hypothetical protein
MADVELALQVGAIATAAFFAYIGFNLDKKHEAIRLLFFIMSLFLIYTSIYTTAEIARVTTTGQLTNSTYNSTTGLTTYSYDQTQKYPTIENISYAILNVVGYTILFVIFYFMLLLIIKVANDVLRWLIENKLIKRRKQ